MKSIFSKSWNSSKQPRKQRKFLANAPLHIKRNFLSAHLSPELRKKYLFRSFNVKKGDKVKIMRGQNKGTEDKVSNINVKTQKVYLEKLQVTKTDGNVVKIPIKCSNLMIIDLDLSDKKRKAKLESKLSKNKTKTKKADSKTAKNNK
jgi:large subunit ribosomal protein L24